MFKRQEIILWLIPCCLAVACWVKPSWQINLMTSFFSSSIFSSDICTTILSSMGNLKLSLCSDLTFVKSIFYSEIQAASNASAIPASSKFIRRAICSKVGMVLLLCASSSVASIALTCKFENISEL